MIQVPEVVRQKAIAVGAEAWLDDLPLLVAWLEHEWRLAVGAAYYDSTEPGRRAASVGPRKSASSC